MQANAPVGVAARRTVLQVSLDRATHLGQLAADLMVAAGFEVYFQKEITFRTSDKLIVEDGFLRPGLFLVVSIRLVLLLVTHQPMHQFPFFCRRTIPHNGPIRLVHFFRTEHFVEPGQSLAGTGKDHQSAHGTVQTVHHAEEHVPRLVVLLFDVFLHHLRQRLVAGLVALHNLRTAFVDDDEVVVFVDYVHTDYMFMPPSIWITCPDT